MKEIKSEKYPLVSVVIAVYDPVRTIQRCIESILKQTYKNVEIIIVDAKEFPQEQKNYLPFVKKHCRYFIDGPERCRQRNRGIKEAKGEYVFVVDQDMYLTSKVIQDCCENIKNNIAMIIPEVSIGEGFWTECVAFDRHITTFLERGLNESCRFFKKNEGIIVGGYDPEMVGTEDSDFHYRMKKRGTIGRVKEFLYHDEGKTTFFGRIKKKYYYSRAFRKYLKRYPEVAKEQFFPIKTAYIKHFDLVLKHPLLTGGTILLRAGEVFAGTLGILLGDK